MKVRHWILAVALLGSTVYGLSIPPAVGFREPDFARILVTHVPSAFIASFLFVASAIFGIAYQRKRDLKIDVKVAATVELGTLFAVFTMATGILFSALQWGRPWDNDPRQISFLFVLLFYIGLMALRSGFTDPIKKANVTSAYAIALLIPTIFLVFVFPRLPQVQAWSLHPTDTLQNGQLDGPYSTALLASFVALAWLAWEIYRFRLQSGLETLEQDHGNQQDPSQPGVTPDRVVRPVAVRDTHQTPDEE